MDCRSPDLVDSPEAAAAWRADRRPREVIRCLLAFPDGSMNRVDVLEVVAREKGAEPDALQTRVRLRPQAQVPKSPCEMVRQRL